MSKTRSDLQKETRDWFSKGTLPPVAAAVRRRWAEDAPDTSPAKEWHLQVAAEWDRITETQKDKVIEAYRQKLDEYSGYLANYDNPASPGAQHWLDQILEIDYMLLELDPEHER